MLDPDKVPGHSRSFGYVTAPEDVRIPSAGEQLAAYLYRPESPHGDVPCVVMAHGFSATRDDGLAPYAEAFRDAGFAVVLFDYRYFGASTPPGSGAPGVPPTAPGAAGAKPKG